MISFENVTKTYPGEVDAVIDLTLEVAEGETISLLGTSGSGKTTTMKMVNRLVDPTCGRILVAGVDIMEQDPTVLRRSMGYAIQHIGLFPHMSVAENIGVVPNLLGWDRKRVDERVDTLLSMVGLEPGEFRDRMPSQLSGGQRQRIGVARALGADPPIILMDEPFGALDPITREELQNEFLELETEIRKTILFVTHDVFEAVKMGDRIALMDEGRLQQFATPRELVENPANEFVDQFLGQHRFQLSLLTRTVRTIVDEVADTDGQGPSQRPEVFIPGHSSLVAALDLFKTTGRETIPVYLRDKYRGTLSKSDLIKVISQILGDTGGGQ